MLAYFAVIVTTIENFSSKQNHIFLKSQRIKPFQTLHWGVYVLVYPSKIFPIWKSVNSSIVDYF